MMLKKLRFWLDHGMTEKAMNATRGAFAAMCIALGKGQAGEPGDWELVFVVSGPGACKVYVREHFGGDRGTQELQWPCAIRDPVSHRRFYKVAYQTHGIVWAARGRMHSG